MSIKNSIMENFLKSLNYLVKDKNSFRKLLGSLLLLQKGKQISLFCLSLKRFSIILFVFLFALFYSLEIKAQVLPTDGAGGAILVLSTTSNQFSRYYAEILRAEGFN